MESLQLSHEGFKAYDIRGVVPTEVNEDLAYRVGRAYGDLYHPKPCALDTIFVPVRRPLPRR